MLRKLFSQVFGKSGKKSAENRRRGAANRQRKIERLERREVFAAEAFVGMYNGGTWRLEGQSAAISFGLPGDQPVMGDWNGDGKKTPGVFRNGTWVLDLTGNGFDGSDRVLQFGLPGDKAVAGDWNGNGIDTVGVYRNGDWLFDRDGDGYTPGVDSVPTQFGLPGDIPVPGDWNGNGRDTPGVFRNGTWVLDITGNGFDGGDRVLQFGLPGDQPVSGDWNRNGRDTPAVLQNNHWYFDLEGDGFTGETGRANTLGTGLAVSGARRIVTPPTNPPTPPTNPPTTPPTKMGTVTTLPRGSVLQDSLRRVGEIDEFHFRANAGERFQLSLATDNPSDVLLVRILRPGGGTIQGVLQVNGMRKTAFNIPANLSGNFIVEVKARNGATAGNYRIGLESMSSPSLDSVPMSPGRLVTGTLREPIQVDQYRIAGRAGEKIQLRIADLNPRSGPLNVTVFKPNGVVKTGVVQVNGSRQMEFTVNRGEAGTYLVHVEARNGLSTGQYRLQMNTLIPSLANQAERLSSGAVRTVGIDGPVRSNQFLIDVRPNQRVELQLTKLTGPSGFRPRLVVYNAAGNIVGRIDGTNSTGSVTINTREAMGSRLLIQIEDASMVSSGSYRLQYRLR